MKSSVKALLAGYIALLGCTSMLAACGGDGGDKAPVDYTPDNGMCIISVPENYGVFYEDDSKDSVQMSSMALLNADTVNGKPKKAGMRYLSVLCNEPFRILTPLGVIYNKRKSNQTLVYWKLNDTLYKDGDNYYSDNTFTCATDTEITPVYYDFRTVGMIMYPYDKNADPELRDSVFFDEYGAIKEQSGVYYLYGVYDFEPNREYWRTNLNLIDFDFSVTAKNVAKGYSKDFYTVTVEIDVRDIFDSDSIMVSPLCKVEGHGYMIYGDAHTIIDREFATLGVHSVSIGDHTLKYLFVEPAD